MAKPTPNEPERRRLKLTQLKEYPLQSVTYAPTSDDEDERLKAVLRSGCYDPLHIMPPNNKAGLPANTILDGHRRARLLEDLDLDEAEVIVRYDLANADRAAVDTAFYDFALGRRNSQPLDLARMVLRKYEIERGRPRGELKPCDEAEARDRVGKAIGMSGRNLQRYFRLLLTPLEVQNAVRDGNLPLVMGEQVEGLARVEQAEIASRIVNGEDPKDVVAPYLDATSVKTSGANRTYRSFLITIQRNYVRLDSCLDKVAPHNIRDSVMLLQKVRDLLDRLLTKGDDSTA